MRKSLYYQDDRSDKVYTVEIQSASDGCTVHAYYGRRGGTQQHDLKTPAPVTMAEASHLFDQLVKEKVAKGYKPGTEAPALSPPPKESNEAASPGVPGHMLLNPIEREQADWLLADQEWLLQPKFDGIRVRITSTGLAGSSAYGTSRTNKPVALPRDVVDELKVFDRGLLLDGELIGDTVIVFDCLLDGAARVWMLACEDRTRYVTKLFGSTQGAILPCLTAYRDTEKQKLFQAIHDEGMEGCVFKRKRAVYSAGRPNSGGDALKLKFVNTCSVIVGERRGNKRSVEMHLHNGKSIGSLTIPPNKEIPEAGTVIEVRTLYRHSEHGDLVQAVYLGPREDIEPSECTEEQLHVKGAPRK